jgi:hypothetical protein
MGSSDFWTFGTVLLVVSTLAAGSAAGQDVPLWPDGAPGAKGTAAADIPTLKVFPAPKDVSDPVPAGVVWQEAESLNDVGGWSNDSQHVDQMGSPYLLATGVGTTVADAVGEVAIKKAGTYRLWVRCRDWYPSHSPGTFNVSINDSASPATFGKAADDKWRWIDGGTFDLDTGKATVRIQDRTGWWGRVDALVLATGDFRPANEPEALKQQRVRCNGISPEIKKMGTFDVVVVGGGPAGIGAAVAAARNGAKVAFIQDRPVLGGNASDEIQVPPMGYIGNPPDKVNVTGIAEEIFPVQGSGSFASSAHIESLVRAEPNVSLFLKTRVIDVAMRTKSAIRSVIAIDVNSGQRLSFDGALFVDTTGHGWVGYYAGAEFRQGTEARSEFDESLAPETATGNTMGNTLYKMSFQTLPEPTAFTAPAWAYQWKSPKDFEAFRCVRYKKLNRPENYDYRTPGKGRYEGKNISHNFSVEYGGVLNTIDDAETIRDELFRINVGLWAYAKNYDPSSVEESKNRQLVWMNYVAGVRESRRLMGDYVMTQKDFDEQREHPDNVAFTDWGIDDHHPLGFWVQKDAPDTLHVYGGRRVSIPCRCLYSRNIDNLFMAGRCMSVSHLALGGVRVMRPACATGQAAGTAAAIAAREKCSPRDVYNDHLKELQQRLLKDGCYIVGVKNEDPEDLARTSKTSHRSLFDGWNRATERSKAIIWGSQPLDFELERPSMVRSVHVSLDNCQQRASFEVQAMIDGNWKTIATTPGDQPQRRYVLNVEPVTTKQLRLKLIKSAGVVGICEVRIYETAGWRR